MALAKSLKILEETDDYYAVEKPTGVLVHPKSHKVSELTLEDKLKDYFDSGLERSGMVHRLDRETSGVLLVAKNTKSYAYLKSLFKQKNISKTYIAVCEGEIDSRIQKIDLPLKRSPSNPLKREVSPVGKSAITLIDSVTSMNNTSLAVLKPLTGRTNQLRVHLAHIGNPIVGDGLYGSSTKTRMMLHALSLDFEDQSGDKVHILAKIPDDMREFIESLGYSTHETL